MDLYLIHSPRLANPDIPTVWAQMEKVKEAGFAKLVVTSLRSNQILKGNVDCTQEHRDQQLWRSGHDNTSELR